MNCPVPAWRGLLATLVAFAFAAGSSWAQAPNPTDTSYPYWGTAPQSYYVPRLTVPVPGMSPNTISNAAQSQSALAGLGSSLGGGYVPPSITSLELRLPRRTRTDADTKAHIWIRVPENAEVWVNGVKTKQTGESRYYYSPPLAPGKKYSYQMRIRWSKDGKPEEETQRIVVQAGETIRRDFTRPMANQQR